MIKLSLVQLRDTLDEPVHINPDAVAYIRSSTESPDIAIICLTNGMMLEVNHTPHDASRLLVGQVPWRATA